VGRRCRTRCWGAGLASRAPPPPPLCVKEPHSRSLTPVAAFGFSASHRILLPFTWPIADEGGASSAPDCASACHLGGTRCCLGAPANVWPWSAGLICPFTTGIGTEAPPGVGGDIKHPLSRPETRAIGRECALPVSSGGPGAPAASTPRRTAAGRAPPLGPPRAPRAPLPPPPHHHRCRQTGSARGYGGCRPSLPQTPATRAR
jgi:hypothetical protein